MLKNTIKRNLLSLNQEAKRKLHQLQYIFFELTQSCNLDCLHCGSDCHSTRKTTHLAVESVLTVLKEIKAKQNSHKVMVALTGGEVLCYPDFFTLGKEIDALEFPWGAVTNGYGWTPALIEKARFSNMSSVTVSLDGLESEHNWLRNRDDSFQRAIKTIKMIISSKFVRAMDVVTCVSKRNLYQLDRLHDLLVTLKVPSWRLFIISPIGRAANNSELLLKPDEFKQLLHTISLLRKKNKIRVVLSESGYIGCDVNNDVRDFNYFCKAGINVAGIMVNGDIKACPNIDRSFAQGNIEHDSFYEVWENKYQEFRDRSWMKVGKCAKCKEWKLCRGNSFHLWDRENKRTRLCHYQMLHD